MRVSYPITLALVSLVSRGAARVVLLSSPTPTADSATLPQPTPEITPAPTHIPYEDLLRRRSSSPAIKQDDPTSQCAVSCGNGYCCPSDNECSILKDGPPQCHPKLERRQTSYPYQDAIEAQISSLMRSAIYDANNQLSYYTDLYNFNLNSYLSSYCSCTYNRRDPYISSVLSSFSQAYLSPQTRTASGNNYPTTTRRISHETSRPDNSKNSPSTTAIVVVSIVGAAVLIIIGLLIWWCCKKCACCQRKKKNNATIIVPAEGKPLGAAATSGVLTTNYPPPSNNGGPNNVGLRGGDRQHNVLMSPHHDGQNIHRTHSTVSNATSMSVGVAPALPSVAHMPGIPQNVIPSPSTTSHRNSAPLLGGSHQQHHPLRNQQYLGTVPEMQPNDRVQDWRHSVPLGVGGMPGIPEVPGAMTPVEIHTTGPPAYQQFADRQQPQELGGWGVNAGPVGGGVWNQAVSERGGASPTPQQHQRGYWQQGAVPVSGSFHEMGGGRSDR